MNLYIFICGFILIWTVSNTAAYNKSEEYETWRRTKSNEQVQVDFVWIVFSFLEGDSVSHAFSDIWETLSFFSVKNKWRPVLLLVCMYYYSTDESAIKVCAAFREQQQQIERKNERETRERERERERLSVPWLLPYTVIPSKYTPQCWERER